jgi:hypothetical protein
MHAFEVIMFLTGLVFWVVVGVVVGREGITAAIRTCSLLRCQLRAMKVGHRTPRWRHLPRTCLSLWWDFLVSDDLTITGSNYEWRGVGDWTVRAVPAG